MPRGGVRKGAGKKSSWKSGCHFHQTKLIRVPSAIADQLLEIAHWLDQGNEIEKINKPIQRELSLPSNVPMEKVTNSSGYNETEFAQEIEASRNTLKYKKKKYLDGLISEDDFYAYLRGQDPQSRSWRYCRETKKYCLN